MGKDNLGDRMKSQYESRFQSYLPRRCWHILRLDGRAFHTFTRSMQKPFDHELIGALDLSTHYLMSKIQGAKLAYCQSDEISILFTDFEKRDTSLWFDGNIQKIVSIAASEFSTAFEYYYHPKHHHAAFDCRVFSIPDVEEVINYFVWRQKDWARNSLQMLCRAHFSHKEMQNKTQADMHEMLHSVGVNWAELASHLKNGRAFFTQEAKSVLGNKWRWTGDFIFSERRDEMKSIIGSHKYD